MDSKLLGSKISKLRKKLGFTQAEFASKLNISDKTVSKWEIGAGYPEITQLPVLSKIFGVSIDYLLKEDEKGIVIAGNTLVDIVNIIDKYPQKNMLSNVLKSTSAVGGCVSNTAINLAKIDASICVSAIAKVGNDDNGRFIISQLQKYGIDVSKVKISDDKPTSSSNVMSESVTGERTFFYAKGANSEFCIDDIDINSLNCDIFHIGYIMLLDMLDKKDDEYGTIMARLLCELQKKGIRTSIDVVSAESDLFCKKIVPVLKYCNYTIMNEVESCCVTGLSPRKSDGSINVENIKTTMYKFKEYGVKDKVIIHCSEAGFLLNDKGEFFIVPSLQLPKDYIKGSVGAGDAFAAACLYGIYCDYDDEKILRFASCASALNLSEPDSISGMKSKKYIEKMETRFNRKTII